MKSLKLVLGLACLLSLVACQRSETAAPVEKATQEAEALLPEAAPVNAPPPPAPVSFDAAAFAGTYVGILPCADCAGIQTELTFLADGSYRVAETYKGKSDKPFVEEGQWTPSEDGRKVQLNFDNPENARYFGIVSADEVQLLDQTANPIMDTQLNYSLKRRP